MVWRHGENVDREKTALQEVFGQLELPSILIDRRYRRVRSRETMRMDEAIDIPAITGSLPRHVTIGALKWIWRVVERPRALPRHPAGLPVIVFVEAAEPAVIVHRNVEMHFVAGRAKLRNLLAH